jgi:hypothetical protein
MQFLKSPRLLEVVARVAPYVFAAGLFLLLSTAVHIGAGLIVAPDQTRTLWGLHGQKDLLCCVRATEELSPALGWEDACALYWQIQSEGAVHCEILLFSGLLVGLALLLSWRVDVNDFSMHHFYRNRLVRCYLGATNPRRHPQPFTGFDPKDDISLEDLTRDYPGPYPLVNATLNITSGEDLGFDKRRAKAFVFTPLFCGYDLVSNPSVNHKFFTDRTYVPSYLPAWLGRSAGVESQHGVTLGTAMAISGAAASPNMGYHTSPVTALFMTLFDVRLGWWIGNTRYPKKWKNPGPKVGLAYLFSELMAHSDQQKGYVHVSDGGHFENLGVYELLKRRCRLIVACDAGCDGKYEFTDLLGLIEKARADFDIHIEVDFGKIKPVDGRSKVSFVVGHIFYDPLDPRDYGTLIYIKPSLPKAEASQPESPEQKKIRLEEERSRTEKAPQPSGDLSADVWYYARQHVDFPHQSTADQWFDEIQFESYRALGEHIGTEAAEDIEKSINKVLEEV